MTTHSSVLAWRIPGTGEPAGLPSMESHRVGHNWSDLAAAAYLIYFYNIFVPHFLHDCLLLCLVASCSEMVTFFYFLLSIFYKNFLCSYHGNYIYHPKLLHLIWIYTSLTSITCKRRAFLHFCPQPLQLSLSQNYIFIHCVSKNINSPCKCNGVLNYIENKTLEYVKF